MNDHQKKSGYICLIIFILSALETTFADPPALLRYQGRLSDNSGLVNGIISTSFKLFTNAMATDGESTLFEDTNTITATDGLYSYSIGQNPTSGDLLSALNESNVYLEITINGTTLSPRERITSAAYALSARETDPAWTSVSNLYYLKTEADGFFATGTPLYAYTETDPTWTADATNYYSIIQANALFATGTPLYTYSETDPIWTLDSTGYYTKVQSDALYATGTPLYTYAETDPTWIADSTNYYNKMESDTQHVNESQTNSISTAMLTNDAVTSAKIADGTIVNDDVNSSAGIAFSKLNITKSDITDLGIPGEDTDTTYSSGTGLSLNGTVFSIDSTVVTANYSGDVVAVSFSNHPGGRFSGNGAGLTNISSSAITDGTIANTDIASNAAIDFSKLNITADDIKDLGAYLAGTGLNLNDGTFSIDSSVVTANYPGSVLALNLSVYPEGSFSGNGSGITNISPSNVVGRALVQTDIFSGAVTGTYNNLQLTNDAVTSAKISDGTIVNDDVSPSAAIAFSKLDISQSDITGLGIPSEDTDTTYTSGQGLTLAGTTFSISPSQSVLTTNIFPYTLRANGFQGNGANLTNIQSASIADGAISNADIADATITFDKLNISKSDITGLGIPGEDTDTTYSSGTGLSLNGTVFSIDSTVVTANYSGDVVAVSFSNHPGGRFSGNGAGLTNISSSAITDGTIANTDIASNAAIDFSKLNITADDIKDLGAYLAGTGLNLNDGTFSIDSSVVTANYSNSVYFLNVTLHPNGHFVGNGDLITNIAPSNVVGLTSTLTNNTTLATTALQTAQNALAGIATGNNLVTTNNSTTNLLSGNASWNALGESCIGFSRIRVLFYSDVASASGGVQLQFSTDNSSWFTTKTDTVSAATAKTWDEQVEASYVRICYTNGSSAQSTFIVQAILVDQGNRVSTNNSTTATLSGSGTFTGITEDCSNYSRIRASIYSDVSSASSGAELQFSTDGSNWFTTKSATVAGGTVELWDEIVYAQYYRIVYLNGGAGQSTFRLQSILVRDD